MIICICKGIRDTDPEEVKKTAGTVCGICQENKSIICRLCGSQFIRDTDDILSLLDMCDSCINEDLAKLDGGYGNA